MSNLIIAWDYKNDMLVSLAGLQSSTMASGTYLNSSTGVTATIWNGLSTGSTGVKLTTVNLPYLAASNGKYQNVVQSTAAPWVIGGRGFVQVVVKSGSMDADFRQHYRVQTRGTT